MLELADKIQNMCKMSNLFSIISLVIAFCSLWLSVKSFRMEKHRSEYDKKIEIYEKVQSLLDYKCFFNIAAYSYLDLDIPKNKFIGDEEQKLKDKVKLVYGEKISKQLERLLNVCEEGHQLDHDMQILFYLETRDSQEAEEKLKRALNLEFRIEDIRTNDKEYLGYLDSLHLYYEEAGIGSDKTFYDYSELKDQLSILEKRVKLLRSELEQSMRKKIKFN